jgi:hypothetical protein
LDVAGEQLDASQQAADAAHVIVAVAANFVAHTVQREQSVAEWLKRREAFFERGQFAFIIRPERLGDDAIGAEHDHQSLLPPGRAGEAQAGQIADEWERSGPHA